MAAAEVWSESEYTCYLRGERERFAWVLRTYGDMSLEQAREAAIRRYPYEPPGTQFRGLIFHDEAWHWAMLFLHGEHYWSRHPELAKPPPADRTFDREAGSERHRRISHPEDDR